ncbi:hypothetical protein K1T71_004218 [Dendrolimus kikuchii]|uniref:Uncharacterized protein n=1 Tax=Dendrolimus kikuchii TaxID=765133 RepID=A0ACC1DA14_9NEOP|nr:hypothetical protein K1T71_004218 [Dendrolimus kikuchii]
MKGSFWRELKRDCFDHISGAHFNPTVTLAAAVWGRVGRARAAAMALAQLAGAALGATALHLLRPQPAPAGERALCVTLPAPAPAAYKAALVEAVLGGVLALVNCAAWDARVERLKDSWPLRIGGAVAALSLAAAELTGASMNPVRSFGPALCANVWTHHWVYWVGPLSGSALCTFAYCALWRPREPPHCAPAPLAPRAPLAPLAPAQRPAKPRDAV